MFYNAFYGTIVLYKYSFRKGILIIKTSKILRKILASSLAVAMIGSVAVATPVGSMIGADISVSAASASPVVTVGDFQYVLYSDGTAKAVGYTGTKNLSTTSVAMPTVVYASEVDSTWSYLQYNSSYTVTQLQASIFNGCIFVFDETGNRYMGKFALVPYLLSFIYIALLLVASINKFRLGFKNESYFIFSSYQQGYQRIPSGSNAPSKRKDKQYFRSD